MRASSSFAVAAVLISSGCSSAWQKRADGLQASVDALVSSGRLQKYDFIQKYGIPTSCEPLTRGELCEWETVLGSAGRGYALANTNPITGQVEGYKTVTGHRPDASILHVEFNQDSRFVRAQASVRREEKEILGKQLRPPSTAGDCPPGSEFQSGACGPSSP
jgi:hypothetical protein